MAPVIEKVLRSAIQNAQLRLAESRGWTSMSITSMSSTAVANEGPRMKRIRPAPMGRAFRYQRRSRTSCHGCGEEVAAAVEATAAAPAADDQQAGSEEVGAKKAAAKKTAAKKAPAKKSASKKKAAAK